MARKFYTNIDLTGFQLLGALMNPVSSDPAGLSTGDAGRVWYNTTTNRLKYWNGTTAIDVVDRSTHQGSQLASTISDLAATVQAYRLDQFAAPNTSVSLGSQRITNLADPVSAQDAATRNYIDTALAGLASGQVLKGSVRVAATTNVSISSAPSSVDGVTLTNGDVVLLTGQSTASQNGPRVFTAAGAALNRTANWDTSGEAVLGSYWIVREGTNADSFALLTNDTAITLDTTALTFVFRGLAGASYTAGNGISLAGNVVTAVAAASGGVQVVSGGIQLDTTIATRKVEAIIPASSSGAFSISGSTATFTHGLNSRAIDVIVRAYTTPYASLTAGQQVELDVISSDANNVTIALPAAPAANNWIVSAQA